MKPPKPIAREGKRPLGAHLTRRPSVAGESNVRHLAEVGRAFGVIETDQSLIVRLKNEPSRPGFHEIDLTAWLSRRPLALAVADYLASWGAHVVAGRREKVSEALRIFRTYLDFRDDMGLSPVRGLGDISTEVINEYQAWLDQQRSKPSDREKEGSPWSPNTKAQRYNALREFMKHCYGSRAFKAQVHANLKFRRNPWPGRHLVVKSREALSALDLASIRKACIGELPEIIGKLKIGAEVAADQSILVPAKGTAEPGAFGELRVRLKTILARYGGRILQRDELARSDPGLARSMTAPYGLLSETGAHLHFTPRSLVPFAVLLAIDGSFNAQGLLTLRWSEIERDHPIYGKDRWRIGAQKRRAGRVHYRSFAAAVTAPESPVMLLKALEQYSTITRPLVPLEHRDRVFLFWHMRGEPFSGFEDDRSAAGDQAWKGALQRFIEDHRLPPFTLSQLRATGSDLVHQITGGDIKAQQVALGHASTTTTDRSYQSGPAKQRAREAMAQAMAWRERFITTGGRADTRGGGLSPGMNSAATPGFGCFEPSFSPIPGQVEGKLCSAYGACPGCPLAWVNAQDPKAFIRLQQLRQKIEEARTQVAPTRWLEVWKPQLAALDEVWLPAFAPGAAGAAAAITLPPIPPLE
ncbi:hypothetical protein ILT44_07010 [Microvirga sp. BT689]|uniref:hypothetical protein n=1 Tax=Microvirga arvi TaxID=2778731 RepID=UPI001952831B|nr:hypothetical protein [Microvirga arvi]MBM6579925.1 hypothetical protein [Microvirga arvi]